MRLAFSGALAVQLKATAIPHSPPCLQCCVLYLSASTPRISDPNRSDVCKPLSRDNACRVFDGALAAQYDAKMNHGTLLKDKHFRCRNNNDIVPCIMPPPYCHIGTEIYLDRL